MLDPEEPKGREFSLFSFPRRFAKIRKASGRFCEAPANPHREIHTGWRPMKTRLSLFGSLLLTAALATSAQTILFDFDNAPLHTSLPISLTVGGVTAQFSGTAQSFSIQPANALGFTPAGFAGNCIYPSSVFAADLQITFSANITDFSILYAPEEYACDSSATMRATAYLNGVSVATATTNAVAGTWPTETLRVRSAQGFNSVIVHYDARPITGGDWGPIFMADNMEITPAPLPIFLNNPTILPDGSFQFTFTNLPNRAFTIFGASDVAAPAVYWNALGAAIEVSPGEYQFTDPRALDVPNRFYQVRLIP